MLRLHGFGRSNYYNMAKMCLLEKGLEFEEVNAPPSQEPDFLAISPMGKVPCLETEHGYLSEVFATAVANALRSPYITTPSSFRVDVAPTLE